MAAHFRYSFPALPGLLFAAGPGSHCGAWYARLRRRKYPMVQGIAMTQTAAVMIQVSFVVNSSAAEAEASIRYRSLPVARYQSQATMVPSEKKTNKISWMK